MLQENHDISAFYRGASLKPVFFNADGTVRIPKSDRWYPGPGRPFKFENSTMGWKALNGTNIYMSNGALGGNINETKALIQSSPSLFTDTKGCDKITIKLKNNSHADKLKIAIFSINKTGNKRFWNAASTAVNWEEQEWITIPISNNDTDFKSYTVPFSKFKKVNEKVMQIAVQPAVNTYNGTWEIDEIIIE